MEDAVTQRHIPVVFVFGREPEEQEDKKLALEEEHYFQNVEQQATNVRGV